MRAVYANVGKRLLDAGLSAMGLTLFSLPAAWIYWRLSRELADSPVFRQSRLGFHGKTFTILKFRTMLEDGQIPPFCQKLRRTAMDELPQLVNILKGDMSFVGPRPLIPQELDELSKHPDGMSRQTVRPGLTGLAQLYSAKKPELPERLRWDLTYVKKCSFRLDLYILVKSVWVTLRAKWEPPHAG